MRPRIVVAGIGNEWRRDDGVGPAVIARLAEHGEAGELAPGLVTTVVGDPLDLLGQWDRADLAVVVDATQSGLAPGTISCLDLDACSAVGRPTASTHGIGLAGVLRLARAIERAPVRTVVVGVEGERFSEGSELTPAVAAAVDEAALAVTQLVEEAVACA